MRTMVAMVCALTLMVGCVTENRGAVTKESPEDAAAYNLQLGVEYLRSGKLQLARERLESSVRQNPDVARAHFTLAILYQRIDEPALADRSYRNAIRMAPNDAAVQNSYAVYLCGKGSFDQAERYFTRAARNPLYPTPAAALANAGVCMRDKGDPEQAENYFRQALEIDERFSDALLQLALLKLETGNPLSARAFLQRLIETSEPGPDVLLLAWGVEKDLGDDAAAAELANRLREEFPESAEAERVARGG